MALDTRGVLAIMASLFMLLAMVVARTERRLLGTWIMMLGFVFASLFSILSIFWAQSHPSVLTPKLWITMASMAAAATVYFGYLGLYGDGLGE
jgi:amino acid transporter